MFSIFGFAGCNNLSSESSVDSSMGEDMRSADIDTVLDEDTDADFLFSDTDSDCEVNAETPAGGTDNVELPGADNPPTEHPGGFDANHSLAPTSYERHIPEHLMNEGQ